MQIIKESNSLSVSRACKILRQGGVISFPTDTVYGLAADASNFEAVEKIFKLKTRDPKKPIAIFVKDLEAARKIFLFDELTEKFAKKFASQSLTLVLEMKANISDKLASNLNLNNEKFLGFRIVNHDFVKNLLADFDGILAVTSANPSGENAALSAEEVEKYFSNSNLDLLIDGGKSKNTVASTVIKINEGRADILRGNLNILSNETV
jgi:L-threonylcarbamoyladenylate synthase